MKTKKYIGTVLAISSLLLLAGCGASGGTDEGEDPKVQETEIVIEVDGQSFSARLYDNDAAAALLEKLPMVLDMEEMNGNEKYFFMEDALPTDTEDIEEIQTGDIMLYGDDCLVLFFQDFSTSYRYTRVGYIEDREGFADALSDGTVQIGFYLEG